MRNSVPSLVARESNQKFFKHDLCYRIKLRGVGRSETSERYRVKHDVRCLIVQSDEVRCREDYLAEIDECIFTVCL